MSVLAQNVSLARLPGTPVEARVCSAGRFTTGGFGVTGRSTAGVGTAGVGTVAGAAVACSRAISSASQFDA